MAFGVCLPPFSLTQSIILKHSTIERSFQKPPFCVAKVWFLACKKGVFALQKYGFCFLRECFLFCNTPYRVHVTPTKWHHNTSCHAPEHPRNGVALVLFGYIIFTYFWVLPTFLYLTNFAFAKQKYYKTNSK